MDSQTSPLARTYAIGIPGVFRALMAGVGVGVVGWLLTLFFKNVVIANIFCRWNIAFVIVALASVFVLMRTNMYRPLLIVLAAVAALWGIGAWLLPMAWWQGLIWSGVLFGLAYALFAWLAAHTVFAVSLISTIVVVVLVRLFGAI